MPPVGAFKTTTSTVTAEQSFWPYGGDAHGASATFLTATAIDLIRRYHLPRRYLRGAKAARLIGRQRQTPLTGGPNDGARPISLHGEGTRAASFGLLPSRQAPRSRAWMTAYWASSWSRKRRTAMRWLSPIS